MSHSQPEDRIDGPYFVLSEQDAVEYLAFLITCARGLVDEPYEYGPMRLLNGAERLSELLLPQARDELVPLMKMFTEEIPIWRAQRRRDHEGYVAFMDECCRRIARELQRREAETEHDHA